MSAWNWWEIPLGLATGGNSALVHLGGDLVKEAGSGIGRFIGSSLAKMNNAITSSGEAYNSAEAQAQRDWEERMSNTAVQRQVNDIREAGLNPWLALNGGSVSGASTPSGASASYNSAMASTLAVTQTNNTLVQAISKLASSALGLIGNMAKAM